MRRTYLAAVPQSSRQPRPAPQPRRRPHRCSRGFTLVELLVVIGIIALLVSILLPSLNRARAMAKQTVCLSNLKNMGNAMMMYLGENHGFYPGHCHQNSKGLIYGIWPTRLRAYMNGDQNVFWCPMQNPAYQWPVTPTSGVAVSEPATGEDGSWGYNTGEMLLDVDKTQFCYGWNDWGCGNPQGYPNIKDTNLQRGMGADIDFSSVPIGNRMHERNASQILNSSDMIVITDKTSTGSWNYNVDPTDSTEGPALIHQNGSNALYADAHAAWNEAESLVVYDVRTKTPFAKGSYDWNLRAPQWNSDHRP